MASQRESFTQVLRVFSIYVEEKEVPLDRHVPVDCKPDKLSTRNCIQVDGAAPLAGSLITDPLEANRFPGKRKFGFSRGID